MTPSIGIDAQLTCEVDGEVPVSISGAGDTLHVSFLSFRHLFILNKKHRLGHRRRVSAVRELYAILKAGNLSAAFTVAGCKVAELSPHYSGSAFNRLVGLGPLKVSFSGLVAALLTRTPDKPG